MIDVESKQILFGDKEERILKWEVVFQTPLGVCATLHDAVEACRKHDINPHMAIVPLPVAISQTQREVWMR